MNTHKKNIPNKSISSVYKYINKYKKHINKLSVLLCFSIIYIIFFSPIIFSDKLLAPGDGIVESVPAFYASRKLWTDLLLSGFPVAADPTVKTWYPLSILFSFIPNSWNYFVVSAYVLASCFTYGYVYRLTDSKLAASVSGIIYGMSGFMMAHLGHSSMIHSAAWMPLVIWSLEELRFKSTIQWFLVGCFAIACCILAGHPQIAVYSVALAAVYAFILGWSALVGKWYYYKLSLAVIVLGIVLGAIQIIPTAELASLGLRAEMSFQEFNAYSLPPREAIQLLFPYFFGAPQSLPWLYGTFYFGTSGLTETTGYVGIMTLILAFFGLLSRQNKVISTFWAFTALISFLLTLGYATPLSWIIYHIPVFNKFRVPARHFIEMTLAFSVLAGIGVAAIKKQILSHKLLLNQIAYITGFFSILLIGIFFSKNTILNRIQEVAGQEAAKQFTLLPWDNPAIGIPLLIFIVSITLLISWSKFPSSKVIKFLILLFLIFDLGSFGWFYEWQYHSPSRSILKPTASAQKYAQILSHSQQRILPVRGGIGSWDEIPVNMSRLWGVPSASGYGPLILSRVSQLLSMGTGGNVLPSWHSENDRSLDIMSVRYVFIPDDSSTISNIEGIDWSANDLDISLGSGCGQQRPNSVKLSFPSGESIHTVTSIGIVSLLGCSTNIPNNTKVLQARLTDNNGKVVTQNLLSGRDTSEWAYDCSDVLPLMQHSRAKIFKSYSVTRDGLKTCDGHFYLSILPINKINDVKNVELDWIGTSGTITIKKISLINDRNNQSYPMSKNNLYLDNSKRWSHIENINQASVYENIRAQPRAWLVPEVINLKSDEILSAIKSSNLPDGRTYNPSKIGLIEEDIDFKTGNVDSNATTKFIKLDDTHIQIQTSSKSPNFLILSDIYYPGWKAKIDGKDTHILKTNYVQRGVLLPEGNHVVEFYFKPISFHIGAGITSASLVLLGYLSFKYINKQKSVNLN